MNISDAAQRTGLPVKTVRYYDEIDLVSPISRTASGYRQYDDAGVRKLTLVKRARNFGFSINECRELLGLYQDEDRSSADVRTIAKTRLDEIETKQRELQLLYDELSLLVKACRGDERPDCPILEYLG